MSSPCQTEQYGFRSTDSPYLREKADLRCSMTENRRRKKCSNTKKREQAEGRLIPSLVRNFDSTLWARHLKKHTFI